jgi:hypothetical protein
VRRGKELRRSKLRVSKADHANDSDSISPEVSLSGSRSGFAWMPPCEVVPLGLREVVLLRDATWNQVQIRWR